MYLHLYELDLCYELPYKLKSLRDITNVDTRSCRVRGRAVYTRSPLIVCLVYV